MALDAPPSYEEVVAKLDKLVGVHRTPQNFLDAAGALSQVDIDVLAANSDKLPPWTDERKTLFTIGLAKEISSAGALPHLQTAADDASAACKAIEIMFTNLALELSSIDSKNTPPSEGPFAPRLTVFHSDYRKTVHASKDLAVNIAVYARRFDEVIIPLSNDSKYTIDKRKEKVDEFIKDADSFANDANAMKQRFSILQDDFAKFIGSFDNWAKDKEAKDQKDLKQARQDLAELNDKLSTLQTALSALGAIAAAALPAASAIAGLSGPFAPFVIVGGLILAGLTVATTIGLYIAIQKCKSDISKKQGDITDLEEEIDQIKTQRTNLHNLGEKSLQVFDVNITTLSSVWTTAHYDAKRVKEWLSDGANKADMPEYMKASIDHAVTIYSTMADYLDRYADGINIPDN